MKLTDILSPERIVVPLEANDKSAAIRSLVHVIAQQGKCTNEEALLKAVFDREAIRSTGIGKGLAVPHGKSECCDELVMALGKPSHPIDFESKDGEPANIIVLLASPHDKTGPHIQALARISRLMLMDEFRRALADAQSPQQVYNIISEFEA